MLDGEVYLWLESRCGDSYDCSDTIKRIQSDDLVITDPQDWLYAIRNVIDHSREAIDVFNEYSDEIPDSLPNAKRLTRMFAQDVRNDLRRIIRKAFQSLGLVPPDRISTITMSNAWIIACTFVDIITVLSENTIEDVIKEDWYDSYNEDHDNILDEVMDIFKQDLPNIAFAIEDVREMHGEDDVE